MYGWVPSINTPIFLAADINKPKLSDNEYIIGYIPKTNYPVIINLKEAVSHHTAILGVTGSGKSVFSRDLIRQIASHGTKIIVADMTGEYKARFENIKSIILKDNAESISGALSLLSTENNAKYPDKEKIKGYETIIASALKASIKSFLSDEREIALFELPDISNSPVLLEYTKLFFSMCFNYFIKVGDFECH